MNFSNNEPVLTPSKASMKALKGNSLKVYTYIAKRCGTASYRLSMASIAANCGIAVKTARKCVAFLKQENYIRVEAQNRTELFGNSGTGYNQYSLCVFEEPDTEPTHRNSRIIFIFASLLLQVLTPSHSPILTPLLTYTKLKVINKEKKNREYSQLHKWKYRDRSQKSKDLMNLSMGLLRHFAPIKKISDILMCFCKANE